MRKNNCKTKKTRSLILAPGLSKILVLSSNVVLPVRCGWHRTHRGMRFKTGLLVLKCGAVGFHGMMRRMPYRIPCLGDRSPCMHCRSVVIHSMMGKLVPVARGHFLRMLHLIMGIFLMQGLFYLLLRLCKAHAAVGGFTDSRQERSCKKSGHTCGGNDFFNVEVHPVSPPFIIHCFLRFAGYLVSLFCCANCNEKERRKLGGTMFFLCNFNIKLSWFCDASPAVYFLIIYKLTNTALGCII